MIARVVAQMLLAFTVIRVVPVDAAQLEWYADIPTPPDVLAAPLLSLTTSPPVSFPQSGERLLPPRKDDKTSYGVVTDAQSVFVADTASRAALFAKNADDVRPIGSITKLMTALVFLDTAPDLSSWVTIVSDDYVPGGRVYLRFDDGVRLYDVLGASVVGSDNTATQALSRFSGLSPEEFVAAMNVKAHALGMVSSTFTEGTGISSGNVSTARDLSLLLAEAKKYDILVRFMTSSRIALSQASGFAVTVDSTDMLFDSIIDSGSFAITGGKTGFIPEAGYCFITTIDRDGDEIFVAVLGAHTKEDRFADTKALAMWAFETFTWPKQ